MLKIQQERRINKRIYISLNRLHHKNRDIKQVFFLAGHVIVYTTAYVKGVAEKHCTNLIKLL